MPRASADSERDVIAVKAGDVLDGKWQLSRKLGEGGMGIVYLARDLQLDRNVAVKLLSQALAGDAEIVTRFEREARLTASLEHPNVVPVYAVGRVADRPFMVMKALEGLTLAELLRQRGPLTSLETLSLFRQLCAGLQFIHDRGFVHRDIKAGNVFVSPDGHATILDFGILRESGRTQSLTRTGMVMGTPLYMSPEQALGAKEIDHRADLYALAVLLFECVTNTLPFEADNDLKTIQLQAFAAPPSLSERAPWAPPLLEAVVNRALAKKPEDRFPSAGDLLDALEPVFTQSVGAPTQRFGSLETSPRRPSGPKSPLFPAPLPLMDPIVPERRNTPSDTVRSSGGEKPALVAPQVATGVIPEDELPVPTADSRRRMIGWMAAMVALMIGGAGVAVYASAQRSNEGQTSTVLRSAQSERGPDLEQGTGPAERGDGEPVEPLPTHDVPPPIQLTARADAPVVESEVTRAAALPAQAENESDAPPEPAPRSKRQRTSSKLNVITTHKGGPMWATIFVDGTNKGNTPLQLELPAGRHQLRVVRPGFRTVERQIKVAPGRSDVLRIALTP